MLRADCLICTDSEMQSIIRNNLTEYKGFAYIYPTYYKGDVIGILVKVEDMMKVVESEDK